MLKKLFFILLVSSLLLTGCKSNNILDDSNKNVVAGDLSVETNKVTETKNEDLVVNDTLKSNENLDVKSTLYDPEVKEKTISEYFNEIPDKYFEGLTVKERNEAIKTLDLKNYYLDFSPDHWDGAFGSLVVFLNNGEHLIATEMKTCGPACNQKVYFFNYKDGKFVDVTNKYLPKLDLSEYEKAILAEDPDAPFYPLYELPRYGTTIDVKEQFSQKLMYKLHWKGGRFQLEKF